MKLKIIFGVLLFFILSNSQSNAAELFHDIHVAVREHLVPRIVAKEVCSCLYNSRLPFEICKNKTGLPRFLSGTPVISFKEDENFISVRARAVFPSLHRQVFYESVAVLRKKHPEEGCRILKF